jgi:hypothetical protein
MSEEKKFILPEDFNFNNLVNTSKYSFLRPMFDPEPYIGQQLSEEEQKDYYLSANEKYNKYIERNQIIYQEKYGNLSIVYNGQTLFLYNVAEFIGNDMFLLDPYLSQEYYGGIEHKILQDKEFRDKYENLFDKDEYKELHEDLENFNKNEMTGRRQVELLVNISRVFTDYMTERDILYGDLELKNDPIIKILCYRLSYNKEVLFR